MDVLDLKLLRTFLVLSETMNFRAAASRLNTTQPAVSNRLRRLESALGVRLLERSKRSCQLTARGRSLVAYAERLFSFVTELKADVAEADAVSGLLKFGVVETIALTWLPDLVADVSRRLPRLRLQIDVDLSINLVRKLQARELDVACVVAPAAVPGISSEPLSVLDMAWTARPDFPVADGPLTPDSICKYPIIIHTGSRHASTLDAWLRTAKETPRHLIGCNDLATIVKLTVGGAGLSLVPIGAVANEIAAGQLRLLATRDPMPPNPFVIAYPQSNTDGAVRAIIEMTKEAVARCSPKRVRSNAAPARTRPRVATSGARPSMRRTRLAASP
jgi:DNA-binding transcriptional LysR family regulator